MVHQTVKAGPSGSSDGSRQRGSALLVALIMLLLMSLIGVGAMQSTILQERMSTNLLDRELAFQAAEAALREAERELDGGSLPDPSDYPNANGLYQVNYDDVPDWPTSFDHANGAVRAYSGGIDEVSRQPEYFIEAIDTFVPAGADTEAGTALPTVAFFRITALGYGGAPNTRVVLSSVYRNQ